MFTFKQFISEMAAPTADQLSRTYYHGTTSEEAAKSILKSGIEPGDIVLPERHKKIKGPNLTPVAGKVYITPEISYAQMYAIGGDIAGYSGPRKETGFGYVFTIDGKDLADIQPDEDSVGEMICDQLRKPKDNVVLRKWAHATEQVLTAGQLKKLKDGEYTMFAHLGKKLLPKMSDADKLAFIEMGAHIAHSGKLIPKHAWKIDKEKIKDLMRDGSNFFYHAERVK